MYNLKLSKNETSAAQFIIIEYVTEGFWVSEVKSDLSWSRLLLEFSIYDEKQQNKLTQRYRNLFIKYFSKFIPKGTDKISITIEGDDTFLFITDVDDIRLKIYLEDKKLIVKKI